MNWKTILTTALLITLLLGLMSFGYLTYILYKDSTAKTGDLVVKGHVILFGYQLAMYMVSFGLAVGVFYKK